MVILGGGPFLVAKMIRGEHIGKGSLDFFLKVFTCLHVDIAVDLKARVRALSA